MTFDEHGGTYDHIAPPAAAPPDPSAPACQFGFTFNRSGVRIPTLAISAWIPERTVVTEEYRATSLISTLRERWNLGAPFTARDATARSIRPVFTLDQPRAQEDWPDIAARPVPPMPESLVPLDAPLDKLGQALFHGVFTLGKLMGAPVPEVSLDAGITGAQAIAMGHDVLGDLFPAMAIG